MAWCPFVVGVTYTREDVTALLGVPDTATSRWYSAYHRRGRDFYVFANVGAAATARSLPSHWEGDRLRWHGKPGSRLTQRIVRMLVNPWYRTHLFCRERPRAPFVYHGVAAAIEVKDTVPVEVLWRPPLPPPAPESGRR